MRPMMKTDKDALLDFLRPVPEEDRFYLKDDVTPHRWLASGPPLGILSDTSHPGFCRRQGDWRRYAAFGLEPGGTSARCIS